jgi:hypothetical protein
MSYKILFKLLQKQLQLILSEVILEDQAAFLPIHNILDNILEQQEIIHWAQEQKWI